MISVDSLFPAKNSSNIPVNTDIQINIVADFELDPRNVSFKINEMDVVPNVFSTYNGPLDSSLDITLYTRRRIKYNTGKRYGQDNVRYGMRDVLPSVLQYGSRYIIEFTVWGVNLDGETETLTDRFAFSTEEGIFYNPNPPSYYYSHATQGLANYFPEWSKSRYDKFSVTQQLLNPIGVKLEEMQDFVTEQSLNNFIQTTNLNEFALMDRVELSKDFEFISTINEDGSTFYVQPEISAIQDITRYDLFAEDDNSIKSFFYNKLPTRIGGERLEVRGPTLFSFEEVKEIKYPVAKDLEIPGFLYLRASGIESSIRRDIQGNFLVLKCRIYGESLFGAKQEEDITLLDSMDIMTQKEWGRIDSVQFFNLGGQNLSVTCSYFPQRGSLKEDSRFLITFDDNKELVFWDIETRNSQGVLRKHITLGENRGDILRNSGRTSVIEEYRLFDIDGSDVPPIKDIAVDPFSDKIYAVCDECLYVFDKREEYPLILKSIPQDNGFADFLLEIDSDSLTLDENGEKEILFKCIHKRPGKTILRYRVSLKKPDGTILYLSPDGSFIADKNKGIINLTGTSFFTEEKAHSFITDQTGDHLLELETLYKGGSSSKDTQLIRVPRKNALVRYKLQRLLNEDIPDRIFIDGDQQLKLLTEDSILYTLKLHKDGVMIDYENKVLYFSENYYLVDIE